MASFVRTIFAAAVVSLFLTIAIALYALSYAGPAQERTFLDREGRVIGTVDPAYRGTRIWTPLAGIPDALVQRTIRAEDRFFRWHRGINPLAVVKAIGANLGAGRVVRGGSTITQQLAKMLLQERAGRMPARTISNKLREGALAAGLELVHSKEWILERYLNTIYYGRRAYGIRAAAQVYFGKRPDELSEDEIETLVRLPRAPNRLAAGLPPSHPGDVKVGRHFLEYAAGALALGDRRPLVRTTLDLDLQRRVEEALRAGLSSRLEGDPLLTAAAVVVDVRTGDVLAMAGSRDYFDAAIDGQVNAAVARRQPGSALKPFTYFAAFAKGFGPGSIVPDEPSSFQAPNVEEAEAYAPQNFDRRYHGPIPIRQALANSYNVPAVVTLNEIGLSFFHDVLRKFGITTLSRPPPHYGLSVTLGSGEVTLAELTGAYAALARGGASLPLRWDADAPVPAPKRVIDGAEVFAAQVTEILADSSARLKAFGFNEAMTVEGHRVAVKTGTSYEHRDNWTLGYSPSYAVGIWVGHADGSPMDPATSTGATGAAPLWHAVMEGVLRGRAAEAFVFLPPKAGKANASPVRPFVAEAAPWSRGWRVLAPAHGATYRIHPYLPFDHQRISVAMETSGSDEAALVWYLDGRFVASTRGRRARIWLSPELGRHVLRVESPEGERQEIAFRVVEEGEF